MDESEREGNLISVQFFDEFLTSDRPALFKGWKIKQKSKVHVGSPILAYVSTSDQNGCENSPSSSTKVFKCDCAGTVEEMANLLTDNLLKNGDLLLKLRPCQHLCIMKDMCADCGENLRVRDGLPGERLVTTPARVSMIHSIPELQVTLDEAHKLGAADEENVIRQRKLVLLVDLDQTLIHTTNEDVEPNLKDVHHFQLYGPNSPWYHVRLRPNTIHFLNTISDLYEMHICTFGSRMYAHKIAEILDPGQSIFGKRILSRDECFSPMLKTANLKALFPCGDRLVCIIDDRDDVWNFASNVIRVKPYRFFNHTGDINAPPGFAKPDPVVDDQAKPRDHEEDGSQPISDSLDVEKSAAEPFEVDKPKMDNDDDDYLYHLEEILRKVHSAFYQLFDRLPENERPPDLRSVIPYVKTKVLKNVNIVFSGVVPVNENLKDSFICKLAESLGANVQESIVALHTVARPTLLSSGNKFMKYDSFNDDRASATTHLVASKGGTWKVKQAEKLVGQVKVVNPDWLLCCAERWEKVDERLFPLKTPKYSQPVTPKKLSYDPEKVSLCVEEIPPISPSELERLNRPDFSKNKRTFEEVLGVDQKDAETEQSDVAEVVDSNGKTVKTQENEDILGHLTSSDEEDDDDELAAALDKEFY